MEALTIMLVDDHTLFREGLTLLLRNLNYIKHVEEASHGQDFLDKLKNIKPDIIFMDIEMPEMDGITATRLALEKYPGLKIIALSMYGDQNYYTQMINTGVKGFMLKNSGIKDIELAIENVLSGNNFFSPEILNRLIQSLDKSKKQRKSTELSEREEEILYYICKGLSNQNIANSLYLSKRTVDKHRENLLDKTHSKNTADLVMYAVKHGIVEV